MSLENCQDGGQVYRRFTEPRKLFREIIQSWQSSKNSYLENRVLFGNFGKKMASERLCLRFFNYNLIFGALYKESHPPYIYIYISNLKKA